MYLTVLYMPVKSNVTELWSVADRFFQFAAQDPSTLPTAAKCAEDDENQLQNNKSSSNTKRARWGTRVLSVKCPKEYKSLFIWGF